MVDVIQANEEDLLRMFYKSGFDGPKKNVFFKDHRRQRQERKLSLAGEASVFEVGLGDER